MSGRGRCDAAARLLTAAITQRVTPAAVIEVGTQSNATWTEAFGTLTYADDSPACTLTTIFDLASLTKVIATSSLMMRAVEGGRLRLDTPVADLLSEWRGADREPVRGRALLDHSSGLPAQLRLFGSASGRAAFRELICKAPLAYPPGSQSVYSDPGFILLGLIVEDLAGRSLAEQFSDLAARIDGVMTFHPSEALRDQIAPTENDPWRGRVLQGEPHDENAAALGGVAGHAGLFGTAAATGAFARAVLDTFARDTWLARRATLHEFTKKSAVPGSSRALGWDTMLPTSSCGRLMSARAIGHTGFTGTSLWIDPEHDIYVVLLTNRVHPTRAGDGIQPLRRAVHDAVMSALSSS